ASIGEPIGCRTQLVFDYVAPLLGNEHGFQTIGKCPRTLLFERPYEPDLINLNAECGCLLVADFEVAESLAGMQVRFTGSRNAIARRGAPNGHAVERVLAGKSHCGRQPEMTVNLLLLLRREMEAPIAPPRRSANPLRCNRFVAIEIDGYSGACV